MSEELKTILDRLDQMYAAALAQKEVLTIDELEQYAGIKKSQIYKMTSKQEIPHYKPRGKEIYFKREEIDEWLLTNRVSTLDEIDKKATTRIVTSNI